MGLINLIAEFDSRAAAQTTCPKFLLHSIADLDLSLAVRRKCQKRLAHLTADSGLTNSVLSPYLRIESDLRLRNDSDRSKAVIPEMAQQS